MLADDDEPVRLRVGETFWATPKEDAEAALEAQQEAAKEKQQQLQADAASNLEALATLRTKLYTRLGDSINLDLPFEQAGGK